MLEAAEQIERFKEYFETEEKNVILETASAGRTSIMVDFVKLSSYDPTLAIDLLEHPEDTLKAAEQSIKETELPMAAKKLKVRITNLPEAATVSIRNLRVKNLSTFVSVQGIIRQKSPVRPKAVSTRYECPNCDNPITKIQEGETIKEPKSCSCGRKGNFRLIEKEQVDFQALTIEEALEDVPSGDKGDRIITLLKEDLTLPLEQNRYILGSKIAVNGILETVVKQSKGGESTQSEIALVVNSIETSETLFEDIEISGEEEEEFKQLSQNPNLMGLLRDAIAPTIWGHNELKQALILQLFGGLKKIFRDGSKRRGIFHILIVGDAGIGKTKLLERIKQIHPKSRMVVVTSSTSKGITAAVVKDEFFGSFICEAGPIVLANGGICCTTGDARFIVEDGTLMTFDELFLGFEGNDGQILYPSFKIFGLDNDTLKIRPFGIKRAFKIKNSERIYELKTRTGRKLKLTETNEVLVCEAFEYVWKPINKLKVGDYIAAPRLIELSGNKTYSESFAYLCGLIFSDGTVKLNHRHAQTSFYNTNVELIDLYKQKMAELGFSFSTVVGKPRKAGMIRGKPIISKLDCYRIYNSKKEFALLVSGFGVPIGDKSRWQSLSNKVVTYSNSTIAAFLRGAFDGDGCIRIKKAAQVIFTTGVFETANMYQLCLSRLGIVSSIKPTIGAWHCEITSTEGCRKFFSIVGTNHPDKLNKFKNLCDAQVKDRIDVLPNHSKLFKQITNSKIPFNKQDKNDLWFYSSRDGSPSRERLKALNKQAQNNYLAQFVESDIFWDEVVEIKENSSEYVYDFTMDGTNNFVANNLIMHNCIDEIGSMTKEDGTALHECMESETIKVDRANIHEILPASTSILAAGNPKFGRFDIYGNIGEQIGLPSPLMSRFDLIFAMRDIPNPKDDTQTADFIISAHQMGITTSEADNPFYNLEKFRHYIAYAIKNIKPKLSDEAAQYIKGVYIQMRQKSKEQIGIIGITHRNFEGFIRLSEASAKARLSQTVEVADAQLAIQLSEFCWRQLGYNPETGLVELDKIDTGITSSGRAKRFMLLELIPKGSGVIEETEVIRDMEAKGVPALEVEELIGKLKREGYIYEPKPGRITRL